MTAILPSTWRLEADIGESGRVWLILRDLRDVVAAPVDRWSTWGWTVALLSVVQQARAIEAERRAEHGQSAEAGR